MRAWICLAIFFAASPALAFDAATYMAMCDFSNPAARNDLCASYMNGVGAGVLADQIAKERGRGICLPEGISTQELIATVKNYIDHKDVRILKMDMGGVVAAALEESYPCRK